MMGAKKKEVRGILEPTSFRVLLQEDVPDKKNLIPWIFILIIEAKVYKTEKLKAGFFVGGRREKLKNIMVHSSKKPLP